MVWSLTIRNIAGIRRADAEVHPGVNAVRASNWQGKSSFLAAVETAFGTTTPLTEGAEHGRVEFDIDDTKYVVELAREHGDVVSSGTPYLDDDVDRTCADLFAFLDETNEVRQAVRVGADLEAVVTRPLELENVDERIAETRAERDRVEAERERARESADHLPALTEKVASLEDDLAEKRAQLDELDEADGAASLRDELSDLRAERDRVETTVTRLESTIDRVEETLAEKRAELDELDVPDVDDADAEAASLRDELRDLERDRDLLQSVYDANRRVVDEDRVGLLTDVSHGLADDTVDCWVCDSETTRADVEARLDALGDRLREMTATVEEARERLDELEERRKVAASAARRRTTLTDRIGELESRLAEAESDLADARERRAALDEEIEALADSASDAADRVSDLESEIKYTEAELEDAREDRDAAETAAERRDVLDEEYDELTAEIRELRTRKERVRRRTREAFDDALDDLLERFDVGFETARLTDSFDLVVARGGREASLDALSEGERELLGVIAALAGYEAFDVADRVPVMVLDGHNGLDDGNLHRLVDYLADRTEVLVLSAYPGYEGFDGHELSPSDWRTVSFGSTGTAD